jgi:hypothetical protein
MGLSVSVGHLTYLLAEGDRSERRAARHDLREINRVLVENGLPRHAEPAALPRMRNRYRGIGLPYDWLHYLRRAVAFARQAPEEFTPVAEGEDPSEDERVEHELLGVIESHLICHSDCDGYYVPIDFPEPLFDDTDELPGGMLGSSQAAMRELILVAPLINIRTRNGRVSDELVKKINAERRGKFYVERQVWLELFEAFRLSIQHGTAVAFN